MLIQSLKPAAIHSRICCTPPPWWPSSCRYSCTVQLLCNRNCPRFYGASATTRLAFLFLRLQMSEKAPVTCAVGISSVPGMCLLPAAGAPCSTGQITQLNMRVLPGERNPPCCAAIPPVISRVGALNTSTDGMLIVPMFWCPTGPGHRVHPAQTHA